jgi:hypothetical protein
MRVRMAHAQALHEKYWASRIFSHDRARAVSTQRCRSRSSNVTRHEQLPCHGGDKKIPPVESFLILNPYLSAGAATSFYGNLRATLVANNFRQSNLFSCLSLPSRVTRALRLVAIAMPTQDTKISPVEPFLTS